MHIAYVDCSRPMGKKWKNILYDFGWKVTKVNVFYEKFLHSMSLDTVH